MKTNAWLGVLVLVAAASIGAGCQGGFKVEDQGGGGGGGGGGGSSSTGENQGGASASTGESSSPGTVTKCSATVECGPTEYCDSILWTCDEGVSCNPRPVDCKSDATPVCACDGEVYEDACAAIAAGFGLAANGSCEVPAGTYQCGYAFCKIGTEYCRSTFEISHECLPIPAECQDADSICECLGHTPQGEGGRGPGFVPGCGVGFCEAHGEGIYEQCPP